MEKLLVSRDFEKAREEAAVELAEWGEELADDD